MGKKATTGKVQVRRLQREANKQLREAKTKWNQTQRKAERYIERNPKKAAAIAAAAGVALGAALVRVLKKR